MFFLFFPNVQQIFQVIPSISAFCSQVPFLFFVYYLFISCIVCFCHHICCLFAVYYLIIFCLFSESSIGYLFSSCFYFVYFLLSDLCFIFSFFGLFLF